VKVVLEADHLFIGCPRCSAWPMAANVAVPIPPGQREISFRCAHCGRKEAANRGLTSELRGLVHV
jgi:hypothetical protein